MLGSLFGSGPKTDASGSVTTEQDMGNFKGVVTVESTQEKEEYAERKQDLVH